MARNTDVSLRKQTMYSVYVRNHSEEGTFKAVTRDLDRIKDLGTDIVWLMPIHPIGEKNRKGISGSPYAISDYRKVNPEYGTLEDFKELIEETHKKGMKLMIDVVYNHTSHESVLWQEHPEWFYKKPNGGPGNKVGEWTDIIDLDYSNKGLWDYQIETLKYWVEIGVDGFRCDVAPLVPVEFWNRARAEVDEIKRGVIWLTESVDPGFIKYLRANNVLAHSDCEIYEAFDIAYDYDTYRYFTQYLKGERTLEYVLEKKREQEYVLPANYVKLRFVENHDNPRARYFFPEVRDLKMWTAFMFFERGMALIYGGQEFMDRNLPDLFNKDVMATSGDQTFVDYLKNLIALKKDDIFAYGNYEIAESKRIGVIEASYSYNGRLLTGIFNVERKVGDYPVSLADGSYKNLVTGEAVEVRDGKIMLSDSAVIVETNK